MKTYAQLNQEPSTGPTGPTDLTLTVEVRDVYGKPTYYPACEKSWLISHIAGTTTLTPTTLKLVKDLGYSIKFTYQVPEEVMKL